MIRSSLSLGILFSLFTCLVANADKVNPVVRNIDVNAARAKFLSYKIVMSGDVDVKEKFEKIKNTTTNYYRFREIHIGRLVILAEKMPKEIQNQTFEVIELWTAYHSEEGPLADKFIIDVIAGFPDANGKATQDVSKMIKGAHHILKSSESRHKLSKIFNEKKMIAPEEIE